MYDSPTVSVKNLPLSQEDRLFSKTKQLCSVQACRAIGIPILLGQILAVLIAVTAVCSTYLADANVNIPMTQNLFPYCLLAICYNIVRLIRFCHHRFSSPSQEISGRINMPLYLRLCLYTLTGLIDTHANWALVAAYQFTSLTSVQLLDCVGIPAVVLLSFLFLKHRYHVIHYVAISLCLAGALGMVAVDVWNNADSSNDTIPVNSSLPVTEKNVLLGDFLVILGAVAYAFSNVLQQYLVVHYGIVDFLACASIAAIVPTLIYSLTMEGADFGTVFDASNSNFSLILGCFAGYSVAMFTLYTLMPFVLSRTSAVLVNLSLLTADVYALLMGVFLFHYRFSVLYLLCFGIILFGVGLFSSRAPTMSQVHLKCIACLDRSKSGD